MPIMPRDHGRLADALSRFGRRREGATAVEFALVAGPFLLIILATMELGMLLWAGEVLEKAVETASRKIYTGEFQTNIANATKKDAKLNIRATICEEVKPLIACDNTFAVDVREVSAFTDVSKLTPINGGTYDVSSYDYMKVDPKKIGLVTVAVQYKTFFPPLAGTQLANGNRVLMATAAFRAEPYTPN